MNSYPFAVFCRTCQMWLRQSFPVDAQIVLRRGASAKEWAEVHRVMRLLG